MKKVILYLGRIHKTKGLDLLIDSFASIITESPDYILVIAGNDDGDLKRLKKQVDKLKLNNCVIFPGAFYGLTKKMAYESADVFVLPSPYEVFGIVILEACACGVPVITTPNCGLSDAIRDKAGLVVERTPQAMKEGILEILNDKELSDRFSDYGKDLALHYSWSNIVPRVESIYREVIRER